MAYLFCGVGLALFRGFILFSCVYLFFSFFVGGGFHVDRCFHRSAFVRFLLGCDYAFDRSAVYLEFK